MIAKSVVTDLLRLVWAQQSNPARNNGSSYQRELHCKWYKPRNLSAIVNTNFQETNAVRSRLVEVMIVNLVGTDSVGRVPVLYARHRRRKRQGSRQTLPVTSHGEKLWEL